MKKLLYILTLTILFGVSVRAQVTTFVPVCTGTAATDTARVQALITTVGSNEGTIELPFKASGRCALNTISIPANITIDNTKGTGFSVTTGQTVTILGKIIAPAKPFFYNATAGLGTVVITSFGTQEIYPEWWGAVASKSAPSGGTQTTNKAALQAAMNAAGTGRAISNTDYLYNRTLTFSGKYFINGALIGNHTHGFNWKGQSKLTTGIVQTAANTKLLDANAISYGNFYQMFFATEASQDRGLIDLYNDKSSSEFQNDLSPQNIRFKDCQISGNSLGYIGVWIARPGGGSQGDNVSFEDVYINGFMEAGAQLGGGHELDYAYNAINVHYTRGDIQGCPKFGLAAYGGNWIVEGTTIENQTFVNGIITQTGIDVNCEGPQRPCAMRHVTSESPNIAGGVRDLEHVIQQLRPTLWYTPNGGTTLVGSSPYLGQTFTGTFVGGDGKQYKVTSITADTKSAYHPITVPFTSAPTVGNTQIVTDNAGAYVVNAWVDHYMQIRFPNCYGAGDSSNLPTSGTLLLARIAANTATTFTLEYPGTSFTPGDVSPAQPCGTHTEYAIYDHTGVPFPILGGLSLTTATSGTGTTIVKSGAGWTVNQFATSYRVSIISGTGKYQYMPITSNTIDTLTGAGWVTDYDKITIVNPDNTSQFVIEPNWNGGSMTLSNGTGSVTFVAQDFNTIGPDYYAAIANPNTVQSVVAYDVGLQYGGKANISGTFEHIVVNRQDWSTNLSRNALDTGGMRTGDVHVYRVDSDLPLPWVFPGNTLTRTPVISQAEFGDDTIRFSAGDTAGSFADVGISRGDGISYLGTADEEISRNILAIEGTLGCKTPFGLNQAGVPCRLQGGLATGNAAPGKLEFWGGPTPGASGTTPRAGSRLAYLDYSQLNLTVPLVSTVSTGTAPFTVASTTNIPNLNASSLNGATFAAPGAIGGGTPSTGVFTSVTSSSAAVNHLLGAGSAPAIAAGAASGTSPTVAISGTDLGGLVTITTGTTATANDVLVTITFATAFGSAPKAIVLTPANGAAAALTGTNQVFVDSAGITTTLFTIKSGSVALADATTYKFFYQIIQ